MKKFTGFLAIFMVVLLCVPSFTAVFADTYSSSVSTVQDGNESESSTDNTTDNVQTYPYDLEEGIYKIKYQNKVLTGVSSEQNGGQTFIFADEQESDEQLFCFEKLEQDKYKIVQQSSQKVLTAQDNTAVFSDWNDDETQYWSLVSTEEETVFLKSYNHQMVVVSSENTLQLSYNMPNESFSFERAVNSYSTNSNVENTVDSQEKQTLNSAQQKDVVIPDGYYEIRSAVSGKNLEVYGVSTLGGAKITQWYATGGKNQKWKVENQADGSVRITNVNSGLVLDYNGSVNAYEQWDWHGGSNQRWEISKTSTEGNYCIRNQSNGYAMDVLYGAMEDGDHVVSYEYNGGVNQQWQFIKTDCNATQVVPDGYYEIKSAVSGKNLEVYGVSTQGGAKITQWDATGGNNQKWKLENQSDGTIRLTNVNSGLVLDYNASTNSYEQWDWHGGSNQRWQISKSQAGNYYIRNMSNNHAMDVLYGSMNNGQYVVDYEYNGGINQQWQLVPVELKTLQGIDVSEHQGNINWQQVKASGQVDFAIIRAGYGRETYQKDKFFEQNYAGAKAQNIPIGIYQYSYADSVADAEREAETCLTWLNGRAVDSYVIFDFEESKIIDKLNKDDIPDNDITPDVLSQMAIAWCKKIEAAGYTPMIYVNPDFITNKYNYKMLKESGYDIWIANYGRSITYDWPYPVRMWQYTSSGSVSGISTNVDMNIMYTGSEYSGKFVLPDGQKGKCNSSNVNVRTSPTTTSGNNVLFQVHNGYQFTILQEQNGWYQVSFGADRIGWISGLYVTLI